MKAILPPICTPHTGAKVGKLRMATGNYCLSLCLIFLPACRMPDEATTIIFLKVFTDQKKIKISAGRAVRVRSHIGTSPRPMASTHFR